MYVHKVQTGLRLEEDNHIKISKIAKINRRSLNAQIELLVEQCISQFEKENGKIEIKEEERGIE